MEYLFLNEETIRAFLKSYGRGPNSKDYELLVAILLKRFCEIQWNKKCIIGFKLKGGYARTLPKFGYGDIDDIKAIIREKIDEDDSIDVAIVPEILKEISQRKMRGPAFQLKRFGKNLTKDSNFTDSLINYLNSIPKKYSKVNATLFIILETNKEVDFKRIRKSLKTNNYPFNKIMFLAMSSKKVYIGEFWPNSGMSEYNPEELIRPMYI